MSEFWGELKPCENSVYETTANSMSSPGPALPQSTDSSLHLLLTSESRNR